MPIVSIDAPAGLPAHGKKRLMRQLNTALGDAYGITENIIFLREYPRENVAIAGVLRAASGAAPRPAREKRPASLSS